MLKKSLQIPSGCSESYIRINMGSYSQLQTSYDKYILLCQDQDTPTEIVSETPAVQISLYISNPPSQSYGFNFTIDGKRRDLSQLDGKIIVLHFSEKNQQRQKDLPRMRMQQNNH